MRLTRTPVLLLFWLLAGSALPAPAQTPEYFEPGYIITLRGDTLRGEVVNNVMPVMAQECRFRRNPQAPRQIFPPDSLRGFMCSGIEFNSRPTRQGDSGPLRRRFLICDFCDDGLELSFCLGCSDSGTDLYFIGPPGGPLQELPTEPKRPRRPRPVIITPAGRALLTRYRPNCPTLQARLAAPAYLETDSLDYYLAQCAWRQHGAADPPYRRPIRFGFHYGGFLATRFSQQATDAGRPTRLSGDGDGHSIFYMGFDLRRDHRHQTTLHLGAGWEGPNYVHHSVNAGSRLDAHYYPRFFALPGWFRFRPIRGRLFRPYFDVGAISRFSLKARQNISRLNRPGQPELVTAVVPDKRLYSWAGVLGTGIEWGKEGTGAAFMLGVRLDAGPAAGKTAAPRQMNLILHWGMELPLIELFEPSPPGAFYIR